MSSILSEIYSDIEAVVMAGACGALTGAVGSLVVNTGVLDPVLQRVPGGALVRAMGTSVVGAALVGGLVGASSAQLCRIVKGITSM